MKYKTIVAARLGGPEVLQVIENELRPPEAGEVRIRVLSAAVSRVDTTVRSGANLYRGTPLSRKPPFTPGYSIIGDVDAVGAGVAQAAPGQRVGVLCVIGGYTEYLYWRSDRLIPVPSDLDPVEAAPLLLNYIVAYQALHRSARVKAGETALIIGASGGIGTALLQLGRLAGLKMYGLASQNKHAVLAGYGAFPIDYHNQDFAAVLRQAEPDGIDVVLDGMTRPDDIRRALKLLRKGGRVVAFGEPTGFPDLVRIFAAMARTNLLPTGKKISLYGTSFYFVGDQQPFLEDWAILFQMLRDGRILPVIEHTLPIIEAGRAHELLESGQVAGNLVLLGPDLLIRRDKPSSTSISAGSTQKM